MNIRSLVVAAALATACNPDPGLATLTPVDDVCEDAATGITLTWSEVEEPEAAFVLEYGPDGGDATRVELAAGTTSHTLTESLAPGTWTWSVQAIDGKHEGEIASSSFVVKATPDAPSISGDTTVCPNGPLSLGVAAPVPGETYAWALADGGTAEGDVLDIDSAVEGTYSVTATVDGCTSASTTAEVDWFGIVTAGQSTAAEFEQNTSFGVEIDDAGVSLETSFATGDGSDGAFAPTDDVELAGGEYDFTTFTIPEGVIVTVVGDEPLVIRATGAVRISGALDATGNNGTDGVTYETFGLGGEGVAGGYRGGDGVFEGSAALGQDGEGPGAGEGEDGWHSGSGAGHAEAGGVGWDGGVGGSAYGTPRLDPLQGGSGGGGGSGGNNCGSGGGGGGGGVVHITAGSIVFDSDGVLLAEGGDGGSDGTGNCGGGGGGSGGAVWLAADTVDLRSGVVSVAGGVGGTSSYTTPGGDGSHGRIRVDGSLSASEEAFYPELGWEGTAYVDLGVTAAGIRPGRVCEWVDLEAAWSAPEGTDVQMLFRDSNGIDLVTDPGPTNDLAGVSTDNVDEVVVGFRLASDGAATPLVQSWNLRWIGE